jgi:RloB-like protein
MGSEDLFHKRKGRAASAVARQKHERMTNKRFLIVCEGTKTEPHYFSGLLTDLRIRSQVVRIAQNDGVSPDRVVAHALDLYNDDAAAGDPYDKVYCVFDRDQHTTFESAVQRIRDLNIANKPFVAITSTPCFEFWLLLHFGYTDQPFHPAGKKSVGDQAVAALRAKPGFANYGKGQKGIYALLANKLDDAITNAAQLRTRCVSTGSVNPATEVDELVRAIQALAGK